MNFSLLKKVILNTFKDYFIGSKSKDVQLIQIIETNIIFHWIQKLAKEWGKGVAAIATSTATFYCYFYKTEIFDNFVAF